MLKENLTKIVATIGPSTFDKEMMRRLIKSGVDVFRLNLSHGTLDEHKNLIKTTREVSDEEQKEIAILIDLPGPKVRLGNLTSPIEIQSGQKLRLGLGESNQTDSYLRIPPIIFNHLRIQDTVSIADGTILLEIKEITSSYADAEVLSGGTIESRKGITILGLDLPLDSLTKKDKEALPLAKDADFIAISFVKEAADIRKFKKELQSLMKEEALPGIIAKIETVSAVAHIDSIIKEADAIMIARGDLGLAVDLAELGLIQKDIIGKARSAGKPVIVATQMLASLTSRPLPTRAEVLDVTNAVIDNADAVMLSEETATGKFPAQAAAFMSKTIGKVESSPYNKLGLEPINPSASSRHLFVHMLSEFVKRHNLRTLVNEDADTELLHLIWRHRFPAIQIVPCVDEKQARRLNLYWGVVPVSIKEGEKLASILHRRKIIQEERQYALFVNQDTEEDKASMRLEKI